MYNFTLNAKASYERNLRLAYGDCDIMVTNKDYSDIDDYKIEEISIMQGVSEIASGRFQNGVIIDKHNVYVIGAIDSDMMKSRYHYTSELKDNEIIINNILAENMNKSVGNTVLINDWELTISQVIEDKTYSADSIAMAIMTQKTLSQVTGTTNKSNFLMIKIKENESVSLVKERMKFVDINFDILVIEEDSIYKENIDAFSLYIKLLSGIVLLVAGLFVTSIFRSFLYKYNHDMAVIRAIGGTISQVKRIFTFIIIIVNGIACLSGFVTSMFLNNVILQNLNKNLNLIEGKSKFYIAQSFILTIQVFAIMILILTVSLLKSQKVLPLEAIANNEIKGTGKQLKQKNNGFYIPFRRVLHKNVYLAIKLIVPKMKDNIFLIITIMMIVFFSFIGGSLNDLIQNNNNKYIEEKYLTDIVVTSSNYISKEETLNIYKELKNSEEIVSSLVFSNGDDTDIFFENSTQNISFLVADLEAMKIQSILANEKGQENQVVLSSKVAADLGISVGDIVKINTPPIYKTDQNGVRVGIQKDSIIKELIVCDILEKEKMQYIDAYIDIRNYDFIQDHMGLKTIYINGNLEKAESELSKLKNVYIGLKWSNYDQIEEMSAKVLKERFFMFEIVIGILIFISGIGWYNSMRSIILSRTREYSILRIQGISIKNLKMIIIIQILLYLFIGVFLGIIFGTLSLSILYYYEMHKFTIIINLVTTIKIVLFLLVLAFFLYPTVKRVSEYSLIKQLG
jgi:putative ABC transport system permease protein